MPKLRFLGESLEMALEVDVPEGGPLVDICDDTEAPIPFSCRGASCGTCRIDVIEGLDRFEPPSPAEAEVLAIFADPKHRRLACSARLLPGPGLVILRATTDEG